ncbi:(p)ppGpp synthetase [Comamonas humi]
MPYPDFENHRREFLAYYEDRLSCLDAAAEAYGNLLSSILATLPAVNIAKIEWRVKNADECIRKFKRKYRNALDEEQQSYAIKDYISDLVGVRVVCLYEDEPPIIMQAVREYFDVIEITDKTAPMEDTESEFGYKGIHMDLRLNSTQMQAPQHQAYASQAFELQIRTIIQDSWSELDHQIKYKKSIPTNLKRRINILSALFELADREFLQIRNETNLALSLGQTEAPEDVAAHSEELDRLTAFRLVGFGQKHFPGYEFQPQKVEFFVDEMTQDFAMDRASVLFTVVQKHLSTARHYKAHFQHLYPSSSFNPFTVMRHCLYLEDQQRFRKVLRNSAREAFDEWLRQAGRTGESP